LQAEAISVAAWGFLDCFASLAMGGRALNYALAANAGLPRHPFRSAEIAYAPPH
jgi:hypothetical protein